MNLFNRQFDAYITGGLFFLRKSSARAIKEQFKKVHSPIQVRLFKLCLLHSKKCRFSNHLTVSNKK